jgi:hypothetical protein
MSPAGGLAGCPWTSTGDHLHNTRIWRTTDYLHNNRNRRTSDYLYHDGNRRVGEPA